MDYEILQGHCLEVLKTLPSESVQTCITSPPYFGLRDYGEEGQIGLEDSVHEYVQNLVDVFTEVHRVLKPDGTLWLNLGDSYMSAPNVVPPPDTIGGQKGMPAANVPGNRKIHEGIKQKDLFGVPWRVAFALQNAGWWLRQDIIWNKPNPMPESVTDRCTKAHEYIFLLTKSQHYYYDHEAIKEQPKESTVPRMLRGVSDTHKNINGAPGQTPHSLSQPRLNVKDRDRSLPRNRNGITGSLDSWKPHKNLQYNGQQNHSFHLSRLDGIPDEEYVDVNKKSVWTVATRSFKDAHFATFPEKLIEPCILAGSKEGDLVLDPFNGAATTGLVSLKFKRRYQGIELNPQYIEISHKRLSAVQVKLFV